MFPNLFQSILKAMMPLMRANMKDILGRAHGGEEDDDEDGDIRYTKEEIMQMTCPL